MVAPGEKNLHTQQKAEIDPSNKKSAEQGSIAMSEKQPVDVFLAELEKQRTAPSLQTTLDQKAQSLGVELPPEKLTQFNEQAGSIERKMNRLSMKGAEEEYLSTHRAKEELEGRYASEETNPYTVLAQIQEFADSVGVERTIPKEFLGKLFSPEMVGALQNHAEERITAFLLNKESGRFNPAKHTSLLAETKRYIELVQQAQQEGDVAQHISLEDVAKMVFENIDKLAFQDRVAAENLLGDHGIRHLIDHNITVTEKIYDKLVERGQPVKAIDRLMTHQIMIDHDLGYAMSPVRDRINAEGIKGQDAGHNLLSAKFTSERSINPDDHFNKVFSNPEFVKQIHAGELYHDSSKLEFAIGEDTPEARRKNLESAIHLADNTHAFEDKLPELLYSVPETLKYMRLMKVAGDTGSSEKVEEIKQKLVEHIMSQEDFSPDDKKVLSQAVQGVSAESYRFSVGRICGNKPDFEITEKGKVEITVQESAIHREVMAVFDQSSLNQLKKFIKDLGGPAEIPEDATSIDTEKILFKLAVGDEGKSGEKNDYQERVMALISEEKFRTFMIDESDLSRQQETLQKMLKLDVTQEEAVNKVLGLGKQLGVSDGIETALGAITAKISEIQHSRQEKLQTYLQ